MVNGAAKKQQAADDPSALAQRLSNIEARLGAIEAALQLDTGPAADELAPRRAWHLWWLALLAILIAVLGFYLFELERPAVTLLISPNVKSLLGSP
jgi:type VI protein secretion system component VasF